MVRGQEGGGGSNDIERIARMRRLDISIFCAEFGECPSCPGNEKRIRMGCGSYRLLPDRSKKSENSQNCRSEGKFSKI